MKSTLGEGPWQEEPDRVEWRHAGFPCLIVRADVTGALCGYVGLPEGHPWFEADIHEIDVSVHGGLTYGAACQGHICHAPREGESDNVFWIGFDCSHAFDVSPKFVHLGFRSSLLNGTYRGVRYVMHEVEELANQALEARSAEKPP
ncbi:MAG TPA: hypothetical protein VK524_34495 [Polyangiaceae bacterium]|nr:hypothetical protein [Polyangiaceae bacterium]